jgi:hypothetical protein
MKNQTFGEKVKGKYTPLVTKAGIEQIKKISLLESTKRYYPYLFFETEKNIYVGITLARQSSDLLVLIAKKYITQLRKENHDFSMNLIQYTLPNDYSSNKLILISKLEPNSDIITLKELLTKIQEGFSQRLNQLAESVGDK